MNSILNEFEPFDDKISGEIVVKEKNLKLNINIIRLKNVERLEILNR